MRGIAFTTAQGRSLGLGRSRMTGRDLDKPFYGIRVATGVAAQNLPERCAALLVGIPAGAFFSHLTAARLWPLPLPMPSADEPVHVGVPRTSRAPRRSGVVGHQVTDPLAGVVYRGGLPVVDPATLFCQLATELSLHDLVAVGDTLILRPVYQQRERRPWVPLPELGERVGCYRGRGKRAASTALALIRRGAESRPETLVRLAIMDAGLPEPEVNPVIRDSGGRFLGRGDLVYRRWWTIVEYDGEQHRKSTAQFDHDVQRLEGFANNGWHVVRIVGRSFFTDRRGSIARVARVLMNAGWRP